MYFLVKTAKFVLFGKEWSLTGEASVDLSNNIYIEDYTNVRFLFEYFFNLSINAISILSS